MTAHRDGGNPGSPATPGRAPTSVRAVAALVAVEGLLLLLGGVVEVAGAALGDPTDPAGTIVLGILALAAGVALGLVARGLLRGRRWARSPALLTQLIVVPVAWEAVGPRPLLALPLVIAAALGAVLLLRMGARS